MAPKTENTQNVTPAEIVENGKLIVKLPGKKDMPKTNEDALARFPQAIAKLQARLAEADADDKKAIRRSLRKLGFKLADARQVGTLTIDL